MKPIFTCFSVCQGAQELLLLGRKENSQGMKFSTQSSRPVMVRIFTHFVWHVLGVLSPLASLHRLKSLDLLANPVLQAPIFWTACVL